MCDLSHETNEQELIIVLPHKRITMNGVFFSDKKKNIIMDGTFTKIQYSESFFTMNGIFVYFPVMPHKVFNHTDDACDANYGKKEIHYNPYDENNVGTILELSKMEDELMTYYRDFYHVTKPIQYSLKLQLFSGYIRLRTAFDSIDTAHDKPYVLKISGIWETPTTCGLSYKIMFYDKPK